MKVILFKLDTPRDEYAWFVKDIEIKSFEDLEKIMGFCGTFIYAEIYQIDQEDNPFLVRRVKELLLCYPETSKDIIMRLFKMVGKIAEAWNKESKDLKKELNHGKV